MKINSIISNFADVYSNFEKLQKDNLLAGGDQKTGVIGEYYAKLYIEKVLKAENISYSQSNSPHDIEYTKDNKLTKIQVKTVSHYSKTRTIAPLNMNIDAFDELFLISLGKDFKPNAFYINCYNEISKKRNFLTKRIRSSKMKGNCYNGKFTNGSKVYNFNNKIDLTFL